VVQEREALYRDDATSATGRGTMNSTAQEIENNEFVTANGAKSAKGEEDRQ
jgi:hypothetical protein